MELQPAGFILEMGLLFTNPLFILPKSDTVKLVIDAPYLKILTPLLFCQTIRGF